MNNQKNKPARHVMLDLETLSTKPNATIVSIGAVAFDADGTYDEFYRVIDLDSYENIPHGTFDVSFSTLAWWFRQSKSARDELGADSKVPLNVGLHAFTEWLHAGTFDLGGMWGNGANFDNVILGNAYDALRMVRPWGFRQDLCMRSIKALLPKVDVPREGTHHNALDDARWQAKYLIAAGALSL
jgi:3' exoribonuclease, RNase T-like